MNKETIYEEFFNVVSDSIEWGIDTENCKYGYYIDGATSMAQALLDRFDKEVDTYEYDKKLKTQTVEQIRRWCIDNSIIDYEEEFSDNGDFLVVLSKLEKFLDSLEDK